MERVLAMHPEYTNLKSYEKKYSNHGAKAMR
jgi:hypothetical protein